MWCSASERSTRNENIYSQRKRGARAMCFVCRLCCCPCTSVLWCMVQLACCPCAQLAHKPPGADGFQPLASA
jgi:hypothetical protein